MNYLYAAVPRPAYSAGKHLKAMGLIGVMMPLAAQADFVQDSQLNLGLRNFYVDRDFKGDNPKTSRDGSWSQGFDLRFTSGYTQGPLEFGLDAAARPPVNSEVRKTLIKALYGKKTFRYLYDFGDGWDHRIKVEKKLPVVACPQVPYCIDGANACPPEDVGGWPGNAEFLETMGDPSHPEHEDMLEWHGSTFDPTVFEWERVNQWLKEIKV